MSPRRFEAFLFLALLFMPAIAGAGNSQSKALFAAAQSGSISDIDALIQNGADLNVNLEAGALLISKGADVNALDRRNNRTLLVSAVYKKRKDMVIYS